MRILLHFRRKMGYCVYCTDGEGEESTGMLSAGNL